jgi:hypothetical protein
VAVAVGEAVGEAVWVLVGLCGSGVAVAVGGRGVGEGVSVPSAGWVGTAGVAELHPARKITNRMRWIQHVVCDIAAVFPYLFRFIVL